MKSAFDFDRSHAAFISLRRPPCQAAQLGLRQFLRALHATKDISLPKPQARTRLNKNRNS